MDKTWNFAYVCLLRRRSTTDADPQSLVAAGKQMQENVSENTLISTQTETNPQKRRKFEQTLQNAGRGSYQALRKAP